MVVWAARKFVLNLIFQSVAQGFLKNGIMQLQWRISFDINKADVFTVICAALALRGIISLQPYSGKGTPPMYGDYEAQRHWQEITINLNPTNWYTNSSKNDMQYWGLDYPPLTAFHSHILGRIAKHVNESFVELKTSRGFESNEHKSFMRLSVLWADLIIYIPAILSLGFAITNTLKDKLFLACFFVLSLNPAQILIDNGHFQYNNISLGLTAFAIYFILKGKHCLAAFCFTLALNYKQMELYHSIPFFVYLLKVSFSQNSFKNKIITFIKIAVTVLATFVILWLPWIYSINSVLTVLRRLFPLARGVFEDKVANFWCSLHTFLKLKNYISNQGMAALCFIATLIATLPANAMLFVTKTKTTFFLSLTNTALAFFLFSFQVHEKSILLVTLPATCLFTYKPHTVIWFLETATFSMFPLLIRDGLTIPYFAIFLVFFIPLKQICLNDYMLPQRENKKIKFILNLSTGYILIISLAAVLISPPQKYPFIWSLIISFISFCHFFIFFIYCIFLQYKHTKGVTSIQSNKQHYS
ncbi:probable dolichyl pyrophosphate Man9GlcNAc2 alpha-1,3-glucosyltransferase isoform X1 [Teleopsis dalmanni]|uniref:probable dolichyl pyrophosphate Man9GlcNAc2 alpha-1,3-glucosyltransferase isoform X1 n=1 Tax=Teleopsis dalmanni TaxID=139649 RepID=UPI0018CCB8A0|nr:probable dolichyl pyrophosphate Man9GlcNAc2 alpha-1,3-glucosyltransferase isoform X1 [Teleopsis dalmanni]